MLDRFQGEKDLLRSVDSTDTNEEDQHQQQQQHHHHHHHHFPAEYLNSLEPSGLPPAVLELKAGCPVILLRSLQPTRGLCNGTRLNITRIGSRVLEVRILGGRAQRPPGTLASGHAEYAGGRSTVYLATKAVSHPCLPCFALPCHDHQQGSRPVSACSLC